ncbi:ClpP/crotonase-like domain-containing protein [Aspergillus falconensis]
MSATNFDNSPTIQTTTSPTGITTIAINRPHVRNAIDGPTALRLTAAFLSFESDNSQKVCVFHGANGTFCSGFDLHEVSKFNTQAQTQAQDNNNDKDDIEGYNGPRMSIHNRVKDNDRTTGPIGPSRMQIKKPVICAIEGYAVAGGLELALLGDMRVVEEDAVFGVFNRRWGVPLIDGGTVRLQAIVGLGRALDMVLTGRPVGAQEALVMGLANRIVPRGRAVEEAMEIARLLVKFPQGCLNADRASCYYAAYEAASFEDALRFEFDKGTEVMEEGVRGAKRFSDGAGRHGRFET